MGKPVGERILTQRCWLSSRLFAGVARETISSVGKSLKLLWAILAPEKLLQRGTLGAEAALSLVSEVPRWLRAICSQLCLPRAAGMLTPWKILR